MYVYVYGFCVKVQHRRFGGQFNRQFILYLCVPFLLSHDLIN